MMTDIEIANSAAMLPITEIAGRLNIGSDFIEPYGKYKAKLNDGLYESLKDKKDGNLILVTAINPTPAGEGKTTTSIGLGQALCKIGKNTLTVLREPSLGPVFGMKGGAAGGGYSQAVPMEDINLHFTGDMHAITAANNLLCALIDNHLQQGNELGIDPRRILFKRCLDMNDRALRFINVGLGGPANGIPREDGFIITVASEIMAILCLCEDLDNLKERISQILVAYDYNKKPVYAKDLKAEGAMTALLKDAIKPNLVQTLENTPVIIHGGPFANIAHGCNSVRATKLALKLGDYVVTEAGFGSDLGAEKFFNIKCRRAGLVPNCTVIVATVRALKYNGGVVEKDALKLENNNALKKGLVNLTAHIDNMKKFGIPVVVAINRFPEDNATELEIVENACESLGCEFAVSEAYEKGGAGGIALAEKVIKACEIKSQFKPLYNENLTIEEKINIIARSIYGASSVAFSKQAKTAITEINALEKSNLPICMAKTQYSLSDNPALLGRPSGFEITVRDIRLSAGAGFIVAICGDIMTMPGLPKKPAAGLIDVTDGKITGLF